jgi:hypothetical protein
MGEDAGCGHDVVVVEQRLAHAEKQHPAHRVIGLAPHGVDLRQHLPGGEVAPKPEPAGGAEGAAEPAAHLRADAHGVLRRGQRHQAGRLAPPAPGPERAGIGGIGQRDAHGLDLGGVGQAAEVLDEAVGGAPSFADLDIREWPCQGGQGAHLGGKFRHVVHAARPVPVHAREHLARHPLAHAVPGQLGSQRRPVEIAQRTGQDPSPGYRPLFCRSSLCKRSSGGLSFSTT